jgi:hypothetical protein
MQCLSTTLAHFTPEWLISIRPQAFYPPQSTHLSFAASTDVMLNERAYHTIMALLRQKNRGPDGPLTSYLSDRRCPPPRLELLEKCVICELSRSEDTGDLDVNETTLFSPVPEWPNRSVHVPYPPLHQTASPPRPHQFFGVREADTGPHQSQSAASRRRGQRGIKAPQNPINIGQQLVFGLDMQPRRARSRRLSSQQKGINAKRRSHGWQACERHKRSKNFAPVTCRPLN